MPRAIAEIRDEVQGTVVESQCAQCDALFPQSAFLCHLKEIITGSRFDLHVVSKVLRTWVAYCANPKIVEATKELYSRSTDN